MASATAFIRVSTKKTERAHVRFRLRDGRDLQLFHNSKIEVNPDHWDKSKQEIKAKILFDQNKRNNFNDSVAIRKSLILEVYNSIHNNPIIASLQNACRTYRLVKEKIDYLKEKELTDSPEFEGLSEQAALLLKEIEPFRDPASKLFNDEIDKKLNPDKYLPVQKKQAFFDIFLEFLEARKLAESRKAAFMVIFRALKRYEIYKGKCGTKDFSLSLDTVTAKTLRDFETFLTEEHKHFKEYPKIYEAVPESRTPAPRGQNTINGIFTKIRTLFIWAVQTEKTTNNPFKAFQIKESQYGTPYYITIEERNKLYKANFSKHPKLAIQRDIFVFQCLIGCRVGDLLHMTKDNRINGAIEYIARKTRDGHPITVRVPLNSIAKEILLRYMDHDGPKLLPFISEQKYNDAIKLMFKGARLNRSVTIRNPTTGDPEVKSLREIASSHLARRCFVGNLYKQVKDPNLVGALSGHKEGSKAFARYREIDEEMKNDLVKLLE
ncbi:phage integrase SAM-like domain-containing protein [bacterium]|nr:phage integrase SAM-like domain-containing protein [bacterium]MBV5348839.1 phage integrase SAM-like domain-containing protein [bacterium]